MSKAGIIYLILAILFSITAVIAGILMFTFNKEYATPKFKNYILVSVKENDLFPAIVKGSALVTDLGYGQVKVGDHIVLLSRDSKGVSYNIRKVLKEEDSTFTVEGTQGRNAYFVSKKSVIGVSKFQLYGLGAYLEAIRTRLGFILLIVLPLVLIIIIQIVRMALIISRERFEERLLLSQNKAERPNEEEVS